MDPYTKLTIALTNPTISKDRKLEQICTTINQLIPGADRVSLWRFSPDFDAIESILLYDANDKVFSHGAVLNKCDFEPYFDTILKTELINAPDARVHPQTQCFTEPYFIPNNIFSLLDVILHESFNPAGVICCESVGSIAHWTEENINALRKVARASSLYLK